MTTRELFLARVTRRLEDGIPDNPLRPLLDVPSDPIDYTMDLTNLPGVFRTAAEAAGAEVIDTDEAALGAVLLGIIERIGSGATVALSDEMVCNSLAERLEDEGVRPAPVLEPAPLSGVSLGVTGATAGVALTGSIIIDSSVPGARVVSLLPETHLVVLRRSDIVPTPGSFLRRLGSWQDALPSNLVLITGPSRSADIELQLTIGVHGPGRLVVALI
jgi:L-lactate utilization protein LutC